MSNQNRSMSVSAPGQKRVLTQSAPVARNWVSKNNQNRAAAINHVHDRQTTKYAQLSNCAITGNSYAGTSVTMNTLNGGTYTWQNLFAKTGGLAPNANSVTYQPIRMPTALFSLSGTIPASDKEWIVWNGSAQLVEIEGIVNVKTADATARTVSLQIQVNDAPIPSGANPTNYTSQLPGNTDPIVKIGRDTSNASPTACLKVSRKTFLDSGHTVKLMIARTDGTNVPQDVIVMSANLMVKTIPMF